jgi:poly(beta-D-mannuronate) lyase
VRPLQSLKVWVAGMALSSPWVTAAAPCPPGTGEGCVPVGAIVPAHQRLQKPLRGAVDVEARRVLIGRPWPLPPPPRADPPVRDVLGVSYYVDVDHTVVDRGLEAENNRALAPVRRFLAEVTRLADGWLASRPAQPAYAARVVDCLYAWASAGALLGDVNKQGEFEREWTTAGLALAYLEVRDAPGLPEAKLATIAPWLAALAVAIRPHYDRPELASNMNNHAYWAGLAIAAVGVAAGRRDLFDWGIGEGRIGLRQVRADGLLPLELARRKLALHYHLFALAPLVMLGELATANGVLLFEERDGALGRLADRVIDGLRDPASFAAAAGASQEIRLPPRGADLAWAEIYFARFRDRRLVDLIAAARPLRADRLGGDLTAAFGAPQLIGASGLE